MIHLGCIYDAHCTDALGMHATCIYDTPSHLLWSLLSSVALTSARSEGSKEDKAESVAAAVAADDSTTEETGTVLPQSFTKFTPQKHLTNESRVTHTVITPKGSVIAQKGDKLNMDATRKQRVTRCVSSAPPTLSTCTTCA